MREIGFDQLDPGQTEDCQHQAGKAGAAAEIDEALRMIGDERPQLRRIEDVAAPWIGERRAADEVDPGRPGFEQCRIGFEPRQCFT